MDRDVAKVLEEKRLLLFKELLVESGFRGAEDLINAIAKGFDVVGDLKPTGHFAPQQRSHARSLEFLWRCSRDIRKSVFAGFGTQR